MTTSTIVCLISLLSTMFTLGSSDVADPIGYSCSNSGNFTIGSRYELNLNKLTGLVEFLAQPTGYGQAVLGNYPDQVYALGLCRGDVSSFDCLSCMSKAGIKVRGLCPGNKGAIIWYEYCMFKYLDKNFFGQIDNRVAIFLSSANNETDSPILFSQKKDELLGQLSEAASASSTRYASGEMVVDGTTTIYGVAECTRDLSNYDCKKCLDSEINGHLPNCCAGKQGAQVLGGSCNVRYETYPFTKSS